ncbi:MAG: hypothetical protein GTO02_01105 [Candidatus Dadabacteria bacterium]|nr:hypothetical protein [Candidatus Dadabacteria bacterium]
MNETKSNRNIFIISIVIGILFWVMFVALLNTEPWDTTYGWIVVGMIGLILGFIGKEKPWLWPIGFFLGELLFGLSVFFKDLFFYSGGGVNMFIPLGIVFLIPFTIPAFIGSFVGFSIRKVTISPNKTPRPTTNDGV